MSRPLAPPRLVREDPEAGNVNDVEWVVSPSESVVHQRVPGTRDLRCGRGFQDEPETWTGRLPTHVWPRHYLCGNCEDWSPNFRDEIAEPRDPMNAVDSSALGRHATETMETTAVLPALKRDQYFSDAPTERLPVLGGPIDSMEGWAINAVGVDAASVNGAPGSADGRPWQISPARHARQSYWPGAVTEPTSSVRAEYTPRHAAVLREAA